MLLNHVSTEGRTGPRAQAAKTTCQICARPILANTGIIAHHGYKRPGGGWQTGSCSGARYLPYEQSCDRLPPIIAAIERFIEGLERDLRALLSDPPSSFTIQRRDARGHPQGEPLVVTRPDGFNPDQGDNYRPRTYVNEFCRRVSALKHSIAQAGVDLKFMRERLTAWVAPTRGAAT